jgi:hypothetical protein
MYMQEHTVKEEPKDLNYWEEHPEEVPEGSLAERAIKLMRPDKKGFQDLLITEVANALNATDPTMKLRHICEAYFSLSTVQQKLVAPDELMRAKVIRCHKLAIAFQSMPSADWNNYNVTAMVAIPFPFKLDEDLRMFDFAKGIRGETVEDFRKWTNEGCALVLAMRYKAMFIVYYMPDMIRLLKSIFQHYVNHDLWSVVQERRKDYGRVTAYQ